MNIRGNVTCLPWKEVWNAAHHIYGSQPTNLILVDIWTISYHAGSIWSTIHDNLSSKLPRWSTMASHSMIT